MQTRARTHAATVRWAGILGEGWRSFVCLFGCFLGLFVCLFVCLLACPLARRFLIAHKSVCLPVCLFARVLLGTCLCGMGGSWTPLFHAVRLGHRLVCNLLIQRNASVHAVGAHRRTAPISGSPQYSGAWRRAFLCGLSFLRDRICRAHLAGGASIRAESVVAALQHGHAVGVAPCH